MTIQDVLNDCQSWDHSKEHFDLMKECSELRLMEQYLADQQYMLEMANDEVFKSFKESGMFAESASEDKLKAYREQADMKKQGIISKIIAGLKKLWNTIISFFKGLWKKITKADEKFVSFCQTHEFTAEEQVEIKRVASDSILSDCIISAKGKINANVDDRTDFLLNFACGKPVAFTPKGNDLENAISIDKLINIWDSNAGDELDEKSASAIQKALKAAQGVRIVVNIFADEKNNAKNIERLDSIKAAIDDASFEEEFADSTSGMADLYGDMMKYVAGTIKFYNAIKALNDGLRAKITTMMKK